MDEAQFKKRTKQFALRVMRLAGALPRTVEGRALAGQLMRCGTSVGANYRAACRARSKADFIAKLAIAEEEADESAYWLELIIEGDLMKTSHVEPLRQEADELVAIITASRKTAATRHRAATQSKSKIKNQKSKIGLSIVELLLALAISAMLLTATMVALNASFYAYASAAESASTQSSTRLVMQRLLGMIRTTTEHSAYDPARTTQYWLNQPTDPPAQSVGIAMIDPQGRKVCIWWKPHTAGGDLGDLFYWRGDVASNPPADPADPTVQPLLERVRAQNVNGDAAPDQPYIFSSTSRSSDQGLLLIRATVDLEVEPGADATLSLEDTQGAAAAVRLVGSAVPRRNVR